MSKNEKGNKSFADGEGNNKIRTKEFRVRSWYQFLAFCANTSSPTMLAKHFGQDNKTRIWDKYRDGMYYPTDVDEGKRGVGIALKVKEKYPGTFWLLKHPLWDAMDAPRNPYVLFDSMVEQFSVDVVRYYRDLQTTRDSDATDKLIGQKIWIERNDFFAALDHLAANLALLNFDTAKYNSEARCGIAENISKTLGPLSLSPWFASFYEEFFDYLERKIWGDLFDDYYHPSLERGLGWRKTRDDWLINLDDFEAN